MADNGEALHNVIRGWLVEGNDLPRLRIALAMEEDFLYESRGEMQEAFSRLTHHCKGFK